MCVWGGGGVSRFLLLIISIEAFMAGLGSGSGTETQCHPPLSTV